LEELSGAEETLATAGGEAATATARIPSRLEVKHDNGWWWKLEEVLDRGEARGITRLWE
jgi:hypothetical protein